MGIASLQKILIVGHKSEQSALLDRVQGEGFVHICPGQESALQGEFGQIGEGQGVQNQADIVRGRLADSISFLQPHVKKPSSFREKLSGRAVLGQDQYDKTVREGNADELLGKAQQLRERLARIDGQVDTLEQRIVALEPWQELDVPVEGLGQSGRSVLLAGMLPDKQEWAQVEADLAESGVAIEQISCSEDMHYCLVAYARVSAEQARHGLHKVDFEPCKFEGLSGRPAEIISAARSELNQLSQERDKALTAAGELARQVQTFEILHDHFQNLANRQKVVAEGLSTTSSFFVEGWIRSKDWSRLESMVGEFSACMVEGVEPGEGEEAPVDLQNVGPVRPFEVITNLYGMPGKKDVDPTPYLAPFFAVFFGLCLTDAGYGLVLLVLALIGIRLLGRGAAKLLWLLAIGGALAVIIGSVTYGYFGNAPEKLGWGWLIGLRDYLGQFGFNPMEEPMKFFILAVGLGYFQLMFGLMIALIHNLRQGDILAALGDQVTWLVLLNSIVLIALAKTGLLPAWVSSLCLGLALAAAGGIILGSQRQGGVGERLGMGFYNLFSAIFYLGDVLSYLRLMALGMVTGGIAMAVNVIAGIAWKIPILGILLAAVVLIVGHLVNLLLSSLSAFVHTLRLQYVEFFPKFFAGGGSEFRPFARVWKYTEVEPVTTEQKARL